MPDDVLRSRSTGTGMGMGVARGLRGMTVFFERPGGLSFFGGDDRSDVVADMVADVLVVVLESLALAVDDVELAVTGDVTVLSSVLVVTVVVMVWVRGLVPGKDMKAPFIENCCATRWVTPTMQQFG